MIFNVEEPPQAIWVNAGGAVHQLPTFAVLNNVNKGGVSHI
jgi:hypothetical protein